MPVEMRPLASLRSFQKAAGPVVDFTAMRIRIAGFDKEILADERGVIVAEDRYYHAALKLGLTEVPVRVVADWTPAKAQAYALQEDHEPEVPFNMADSVRQNQEWY